MPSCLKKSTESSTPFPSTSLPLAIRQIKTIGIATFFPVGESCTPRRFHAPVCVPVAVTRTQTISSSAMISSIVSCQSGKPLKAGDNIRRRRGGVYLPAIALAQASLAGPLPLVLNGRGPARLALQSIAGRWRAGFVTARLSSPQALAVTEIVKIGH